MDATVLEAERQALLIRRHTPQLLEIRTFADDEEPFFVLDVEIREVYKRLASLGLSDTHSASQG